MSLTKRTPSAAIGPKSSSSRCSRATASRSRASPAPISRIPEETAPIDPASSELPASSRFSFVVELHPFVARRFGLGAALRAHLLEPGGVQIAGGDLDLLRDLVTRELVTAIAAHPLAEARHALGGVEPDAGSDDVAEDPMYLSRNDDVEHAGHFLKHPLDLGREDLLASDVDHLRTAAQDAHVPAVHFHGISCREPAVGRERAGSVQVAEHRGGCPDLEHAVDDSDLRPRTADLQPQRVVASSLRVQDPEFREPVLLNELHAGKCGAQSPQRALEHDLRPVTDELQARQVEVTIGLADEQEVEERG